MAALTSGQHAGILMFLWIIGSVAAGVNVKVKPGEDVTLQCNAFTDAAITVVEWKRPELKRYVFFFRDNRLYESYQNPRYQGRVELSDPEMKNGDVSVLLKSVTVNDTGTYECEVITNSNTRRKRDVGDKREFVRSVHLIVSDDPEEHHQNGDANDEQPGGSRGYVVGVVLGVVCLVAVVVGGVGVVVGGVGVVVGGVGVVVGGVGVVVGGVGVVVGLVVKSKRAKVKRPLESVDENVNVKLNP